MFVIRSPNALHAGVLSALFTETAKVRNDSIFLKSDFGIEDGMHLIYLKVWRNCGSKSVERYSSSSLQSRALEGKPCGWSAGMLSKQAIILWYHNMNNMHSISIEDQGVSTRN